MVYLIQPFNNNRSGESGDSVDDFNIKIKNKEIKTLEEIKKENIFKFTVIKNKKIILYSTDNTEYESIYGAFKYGHIDVIKYLNDNNCLKVELNNAIEEALYNSHIEILEYYKNYIKNFHTSRNILTVKVYDWFLKNNINIKIKKVNLNIIKDHILLQKFMFKYPKIFMLKIKKYKQKKLNIQFKLKNIYFKGYKKN